MVQRLELAQMVMELEELAQPKSVSDTVCEIDACSERKHLPLEKLLQWYRRCS
jgi:hypothetical protein